MQGTIIVMACDHKWSIYQLHVKFIFFDRRLMTTSKPRQLPDARRTIKTEYAWRRSVCALCTVYPSRRILSKVPSIFRCYNRSDRSDLLWLGQIRVHIHARPCRGQRRRHPDSRCEWHMSDWDERLHTEETIQGTHGTVRHD